MAYGWEIERIGKLRGDLEHFVCRETVTMSLQPYKHRRTMMGLLAPKSEGIFEIRSRRDSPGIRIFGRFACRDTFVALSWRPRSKRIEGLDKNPIGNTQSNPELQFAVIEAIERWQEAIPDLNPLVGGEIHDYIS